METIKEKFCCTVCNKPFATKSNLSRHKQQAHHLSNVDNHEKPQGKFNCNKCNTRFTTKGNLTRHNNEKHSSDDDHAVINKCPACHSCFSRCDSLLNHIDTKHQDELGICGECDEKFSDLKKLFKHKLQSGHKAEDVVTSSDKERERDERSQNYECDFCNKNFSCIQNLKRHIQTIHRIENKTQPTIECPLCDEVFHKLLSLEKHLQLNHGIQLNDGDIEFDSIEDFKKWKKDVEKEDLAFFYFKRSVNNRNYYECHRSGSRNTTGSGSKMKWSDPTKCGKICPAKIITTNVDGRIYVHYQRAHVGHTQSLRFLHLTKEERDELADKIRNKMSFDQILDSIRDSVHSAEDINRIHLVDKRDLQNIKRDYNLDRNSANKNDAFSVEMWVKQQETLNEDSPVLYFKMQGQEDGGPLLKDDFMIVLMTPYQKDVIVEYGSDIICVDSTHKTTGHDFQLTTLVTVDEFGAGCPVAFCLSNRIDATAMAQYFRCVEKKVGKIFVNVYMSDDSNAYINAWIEVMSKPNHILLCTWHVDKNWRINLVKVKGDINQQDVYKACRTLLECLDIKEFEECLDRFLIMCSENPDTAEFGKYFDTYYASRPEKWAFCHRKGLKINTNMYLEAMHKKYKHCYMEGKVNKRVDKCISFLMQFARDMMYDRIIRLGKNKPTYRMQRISNSHRRSLDIKDDMVENIEANVWIIQSSIPARGPYTVSLSNSECSKCPLSCPLCKICVHQYICTCVDHVIKGNFCKHVHACVRFSKKEELNFPMNEELITSKFENHNDKVLKTAKNQTSHLGDSVPELSRLQSIFHTICTNLRDSNPETLSKALSRAQGILDMVQKENAVNAENSASSTGFSELPKNLPSHQNLEKQRQFYSTKNKRVTPSRKLAKPTDAEQASIRAAIVDPGMSSEVVHTEFDHSYVPNTVKYKLN